MDRLSIVALAALLLAAACGTDKTDAPSAPPPGRVVAVKAKEPTAETPAEFCDVHLAGQSKKLVLPELDAPFSAKPGSRQWINIWATWCKPCIAEMPMLATWRDQMAGAGTDVDLAFLSVDEDKDALAGFLKANAYMKQNLHLKDPEALPAWLEQLGLDKGAGLPIHIFTDTAGYIRCVRAAAISKTHYPTISKIFED